MSDHAIEALRREVAQLRNELAAEVDWANGIHHLLLAVLPSLLRGHPEVEKVRGVLAAAAKKYDELLAHPHRARPDERLGLYEAKKSAYRALAQLGVWPGGDPPEATMDALPSAGIRPPHQE